MKEELETKEKTVETPQIDFEQRISSIESKIGELTNLKAELFDMLVSNINESKKSETPKQEVVQENKKILEDF